MKKVKVTIWNSETRQNEIKDAELLKWGLSYEELRDGVGTYSVVFVMLNDGTVKEVHPSLVQFVIDEKQQKIEAAANVLFEALKGISDYWNTPQSGLSLNDHFEYVMKIADQAIKKATE